MNSELRTMKKQHLAFLQRMLKKDNTVIVKNYLQAVIDVLNNQLMTRGKIKTTIKDYNNEIYELLVSIGFSNNQSKVYALILANKTLKASDLVAKGFVRTEVYYFLNHLINMGLVGVAESTYKFYFATDKENPLKEYLAREKNEIQKIFDVAFKIRDLVK